jgi:quercetin dioxygenase-like cupin family protein
VTTTTTLDQLIAAGDLTVVPEASLPLRGGQVLSILRVTLAPGIAEPRHTHPGVEILRGLTGRGHVELDRGEQVPITPGGLVQVGQGRVKSLVNDGEDAFTVLATLILDDDKPPLRPA